MVRKATQLHVSLHRLPDRLGGQKLSCVYQLLVPPSTTDPPATLREDRKEVTYAARSVICPRLF